MEPVKGGSENTHGKVNILLQTYISGGSPSVFSLVSDMAYVAQNAARILRGLFEIALRRNWASMTHKLLTLCKMLDRRLWDFQTPLRQLDSRALTPELLTKMEEKKLTPDRLRDLSSSEIGHLVHHVRQGDAIKAAVHQLPHLQLHVAIQPITRTVITTPRRVLARPS